jgi:hypothetical protein
MSSLFNIAAGGETGFYPFKIDNSLRFDDGSTTYLTQTFSAGDRDLYTISFWVKRCLLGSTQYVFGAHSGAAIDGGVVFTSSDTLGFSLNGNVYNKYTSAVFRDTSAWYNFVIIYDSAQSTAADRIKIYANSVEQTDYTTSNSGLPPSSYDSLYLNNNKVHTIGKLSGYSQNYFDGYLADFNFIDGQALAPSNFGETKSGVWVPKDTSGLTFGTNGFRLEFKNSSDIGNDTSGQDNDWSTNNFVTADVVSDSPTNNFATMNPLDGPTFSTAFGNLRVNGSSSTAGSIGSTFFPTTGKWYVEMVAEDMGNGMSVGIKSDTEGTFWKPTRGKSVIYQSDGHKIIDGGSAVDYGATYTVGDIIGLKINLDDGEIEFLKNNASQGNASTALTSGVAFGVFFLDTSSADNARSQFNFGQDSSFRNTVTSGSANASDANGHGDFYYSVPSGYLALVAENLPEPSISPLNDEPPEDHFDTQIWTGTGSSNSISSYQFAPDWVWIKQRNATQDHTVQDSVRGVGKYLSTNDTDSESTSSTQITSFDSNGFTLGTAISTNDNNDTYVGWAWLAGGSASSNTDGSITSSVSANTKAGFSIVGFTSASSGNFTVGHGLGVTPEVIIQKERGSTGSWHVWHESVTTNTSQYLKLETTGGVASVSNVWGASVPNSTTFGLGVGVSVDANNTQIAYCFHSVRGYSKFGSYTGTGSTDGVFVFTGFRPALLIVKQTDASNRWIIFDNKRGDINPLEEKLELNPNDDTAESSSGTDCFDFLSNGFKLRRSGDVYNGSGHDYIFMAFAEMPFKYANAR